ncbi:MAG: preprotein translocase subunit SecE [Candidatus Spechtbacterales bacterium]
MANLFVATVRFLKEVRIEMKKVTWLKRPEVLQYTVLVIVISAVVGVYLGALDFVFSWMVANFLL